MELQEFITETLVQVTNGVKKAQEKIKGTGCLINPEGYSINGEQIKQGFENEYRQIQKIKMTVVLNVSEKEGSSAGIGVVASIFKAGVSMENEANNSTNNTIEFEIPIALPVMENEL